jgi:hypothetical protein
MFFFTYYNFSVNFGKKGGYMIDYHTLV